MKLDVPVLAGDDLGTGSPNRQRISEVRALAAACSDEVPFLLAPVRLQTRFVQVQVPVTGLSATTTGLSATTAEVSTTTTGSSAAVDLAASLDRTCRYAETLASRDYAAPVRGDNAKQRRAYKKTETARIAQASREIASIATEITAAQLLLRDVDPADRGTATLAAPARRLAAALQTAETALASIRSDYHRTNVTSAFEPVARDARDLLRAVESSVLPATRLYRTLRTVRQGTRVPRDQVTASAAAHTGLSTSLDTLAGIVAELDRAGTDAVARQDRFTAAPLVDVLDEALTHAARITVLPEQWQQDLTHRVGELTARLRTTVAPVRAASLQGGADLAPTARITEDIADRLTTLEAVITGISTDAAGVAVTSTRTVDQLRIRIFPDDFAVVTHEPRLTDAERHAGQTYWRQAAEQGGDRTARLAAWRALCVGYGPQRAAWIVRQTRPAVEPVSPLALADTLTRLDTVDRRLADLTRRPGRRVESLEQVLSSAAHAVEEAGPLPPGAAERIREQAAPIAAKLAGLQAAAPDAAWEPVRSAHEHLEAALSAMPTEPAPDPVSANRLAATDGKDAAWTLPPRAGLLPRRFVAITVSGNRVSHVVAGTDVRPDLALGLDPRAETAERETARIADDGTLVMGASLRWLTDFDEAAAAGMAITIPITAQEAATGFDRVYVLGLSAGTDPQAGARMLAEQLDNHHYSPRGLALVPVGTPTNNTDAGTAGYRGGEDPDRSFAVELDAPLVTGRPGKPDGLRLARGLGVAADVFDHVAAADGSDIDNALLANAALWPATAGYALEELLGRVLTLGARDQVQRFAVEHVIGRGALPALRVGPQPYGVLPTVAYTRYQPDTGAPAFEGLLRDVLLLLYQDWAAAATKVRHAHSTPDGQNQVLSVLGLDAVAAGYAQRLSVNAGRDGMGFGWTSTMPPDVTSTLRVGPLALLQRFQAVFDRAVGRASSPLTEKGSVAEPYRNLYRRISGSRGYEVTYLEKAVELTEARVVPDGLAADIATVLRRSLGELAQDIGHLVRGRSLLHLLVCQALLAQARDVALRILKVEGIVDEELRARVGSGDLFSVPRIGGSLTLTRWRFLLGDLAVMDGLIGPRYPAGPGTLYGYLRARGRRMDDYLDKGGANQLAESFSGTYAAEHRKLMAPLVAHRAAVAALAGLGADTADQVTREHLDTCSHRLDAWLLGLANQRLDRMRTTRPSGIHIGAYGWVEGLKRDDDLTPAVGLPAALNPGAGKPVYADRSGAGFIHAPSLNHAATAAILRSGFVAHGGAGRGEMAVNVSSRRVRSALALLDGVAAGNELGALLGYQFERDLHDAADTGVILDDLIAPLRKRYPSMTGVDGDIAAARTDLRHVVDGARLLDTVRAWLAQRGSATNRTLFEAMRDGGTYRGYPYGLVADDGTPLLPPISNTARLDPVLRAIDRLADTVDALGDLVVAEGTHQLTQGNHARAAAVLSAFGAGKLPPRPEIVDTPVDGTLVSHRVLLHLTPGARPPAGWSAPSARAAAEPALNAWLGELIGPPGLTRMSVIDEDGRTVATVSLTELAIQPIDLLAMLHQGLDDAMTELTVRVLDTQRPIDVRDGVPPPALRLSLERDPAWPAHIRSLADTAALVEQVAAMMRVARPATSADYVLTDTVTSAGTGADTAELNARVAAAVSALQALGGRLVALVSDGADADLGALGDDPVGYLAAHAGTYRGGARPGEPLPGIDRLWARRHGFREALLDALGFGITGITLPTHWESRDKVGAAWLAAAESALLEVARRVTAAQAVAGTDITASLAVAREIFTATLPVIPLFRLSNRDDVAAALAAPPTAEPELAVARWLTGAATVREGLNAYQTATALAEAFGGALPEAVPVQFPRNAGEPWVGEAAPTAAGGRVSLVLLQPGHLTAYDEVSALCLDGWDETIPSTTRTTGVAFNYNQPDAEPPQALLLAVPPARRGAWRWEDLIQTLHDTLELSKIRAVEPEHLQDDLYGQLLPLLIGELPPFTDSGSGSTATSDSRVFLDFASIQPAEGPSS
ncbi:hypothetical protein GA0074695_4247 [Micromonospora viridifaciens]|uniref:Uncharacterized protein n=1 Tax=Micromonospora viridifaciens TaxID=1881 RepID=A0A1C4YG67_MICVI|nr:hypothetical protein [Micromonospora viridifaciens]SCF19725.1 hypothetical protein GA0074695_4247 [Micromonospora viridifaciens]